MIAPSRSHSVLGLAVVAAIGSTVIVTSAEARANGRLPAAHELVISPTNPDVVAIEATFGLFLSQDTGTSFGWVCEPAIGYPATLNWDPVIAITSSAILASLPNGVAVSTDQGCSWQTTLKGQVIDIVVSHNDPHSALALVSGYTGLDDAGDNTFSTQVLATHDDGATWTQQGSVIEPDVQVETIDIAPSDPDRIYIGGGRTLLGEDGSVVRSGIVLASTNGGASYVLTTIPLQQPAEFESSAFVSAVDPNDPDRVYVRISLSTAAVTSIDRLVVSDDGAATFTTAYQARGALPGFALSSDGAKVFLGDSVAGIFLSSAPAEDSGASFSFTQRSPTSVTCLAWSAGSLYACTGQPQNPGLNELGVSSDDGLTFAPRFRFGCVSGPLSCSSGNLDGTCGQEFTSIPLIVGPCDAGSGGQPDASAPAADAGAEVPRPPSRSCTCEAGAAAGGAGFLSAAALLLALVARRRRS